MKNEGREYAYTWEEAIKILRDDPRHKQLVYDAYLTSDLLDNCERFYGGREFAESLSLLRSFAPEFRTVLDMPGGNGIASYALAKAGYDVTVVEPDPSSSVGRGAINSVLERAGLVAKITDAFGEELPYGDASFDVVYVRQGLHHARNLPVMLRELARVLKPKGLLLAAREHVVDNYGASLEAFLDSQVDHQLYGGENAFTLRDYRQAFLCAGLATLHEFGPYDSAINIYPNDVESLKGKILASPLGKLLALVLPQQLVVRLGMWRLRTAHRPGRLYTFLTQKRG